LQLVEVEMEELATLEQPIDRNEYVQLYCNWQTVTAVVKKEQELERQWQPKQRRPYMIGTALREQLDGKGTKKARQVSTIANRDECRELSLSAVVPVVLQGAGCPIVYRPLDDRLDERVRALLYGRMPAVPPTIRDAFPGVQHYEGLRREDLLRSLHYFQREVYLACRHDVKIKRGELQRRSLMIYNASWECDWWPRFKEDERRPFPKNQPTVNIMTYQRAAELFSPATLAHQYKRNCTNVVVTPLCFALRDWRIDRRGGEGLTDGDICWAASRDQCPYPVLPVYRGQIHALIGYSVDLKWAVVWQPTGPGVDYDINNPLRDAHFGFVANGRLGIVPCSVVAPFKQQQWYFKAMGAIWGHGKIIRGFGSIRSHVFHIVNFGISFFSD
jgi:hypothetical protein